MRVFHGKIEIAGQMGILCGALKSRGHIAVGYNIFHSYLGYQEHLINTIEDELANMAPQIMSFFDIFHFHYNSSILPNYADLPLLKAKGKKMVMHHWGNDVRFHEQAREKNRFVYTGDSPPNEKMDEQLRMISTYVREAIVQDHEVLPYVAPYYEKVHILPIAIDMRRFTPQYPDADKKKPLIIHAPTNPDFKGTAHIERAIERLRESYDFEYRRIEKMNHLQAIQLYREADLIVDQILCGSHGLFSVEAMAFGKPVIAYIRDDLVATFPQELPIVNANPETVEEKIRLLLDHPLLRQELGIKGRAYAEQYHSREVVVDKLLQIYAGLQV